MFPPELFYHEFKTLQYKSILVSIFDHILRNIENMVKGKLGCEHG